MKTRFSFGLSIALLFVVPITLCAVPPRDNSRKTKPSVATRPAAMPATPSLSGARRPSIPGASPSQSGGRPSASGQRPGGRPPASVLPGGLQSRPTGGTHVYTPGVTLATNKLPGQPLNPYRPAGNRPDVIVNRPDINFGRPVTNRPSINSNTGINYGNVTNTVVNNNTTVINQNYGNQNYGYQNNQPGRRPGNYDRPYRPYYPELHYHWRPSNIGFYQPAYYNYTYNYPATGGGLLSVGVTNYAFANPFYVRSTGSAIVYDYSRLIQVPAPNATETDADLTRSERAVRRFDDARELFRRGEYGRANDLIDEAIQLLPTDPTLHEMRSLILFARQRYPDAAATLYSVLAVSPGWDAATFARLYDDPKRYLEQVNDLEDYVRLHPGATDAQFLLAYHRMVKGDVAGTQKLLEVVRDAKPNDRVVQNLLDAIATMQR